MATAMFQSVAATDGETTFGSITPITSTAEADISWCISLQFLSFDGGTDPDNDYTWDGEKWLKDGWQDVTSETIPAGQGLWVGNNAGVDVALRSAGEVNMSKNGITYLMNDEGGTAVGNSFPMPITFANVFPVAKDGVSDISWCISLQYLSFDGGTDPDNDYTWDGEKWLKDGWQDVTNEPIPAGKGMWVGNNAGTQVSFNIVLPVIE